MISEIARIVKVAGFVILFLGLFLAGFRWVANRASGIPKELNRALPEERLVLFDPFLSPQPRDLVIEFLGKKERCPTTGIWIHVGESTVKAEPNQNYLEEVELVGELQKKLNELDTPLIFELHQNDEHKILALAKKLHERFPKAVFYTQFHKINDKIVRKNPNLRFASHQAGLLKNQLYLQLNIVDPSLLRFEFYLADSRNVDLLGEPLLNRLRGMKVRIFLKGDPSEAQSAMISGFVSGAPSHLASSTCHYGQVSKK